MSTRNIVLRLLAALSVVMLLAACEETTLETSPEAIVRAIPECSDYEPPESVSEDWGEAQGIPNEGVEVISVNEGYTVEICAGGGNQRYDGTFTGPGMLEVGSNFNGWSVTGFTPPPTVPPTDPTVPPTQLTTTTEPATTTTAGGDTTTTQAATTLTQGEVTTTTAGEVTTTAAGEVTTTLSPGEVTTTTQAGAVTTTEAGGPTTTAAGATTTADVGGGTLEPGQETSTTGGPTTSGDPGEETSTTADEVEGGSEDTLPYTGAGDMTMGGLAGMLVAAGIVLLLLTRKRSGAE
jgi:LPXTG-motif cell wall-anchored protein